MIVYRNRFNLCLVSAVALALLAGCRTHKDSKEKEIATLRVHVEVVPESKDFSTSVSIDRESPVMITVDKDPFLTEANVEEASVVDVLGGYDLRIKFDRRGTWLLEEYTASNPGKHFAVFSAFPDKKGNQSRWLGAPILRSRISNGVLSLAPDASREEAQEISRGLNNVARKNREQSKW